MDTSPDQTKKDFMERLVELVRDDKELHDALVRLIDSMANREKERADWYARRQR